jgi:signal transduction histidine kinase
MDQIARAAVSGGSEHLAGAAQRDNDALERMVVKLNRQLLAESRQLAAERAELRVLRQANEHLVLAAFRAEDARAAAEAARERQTVFLSMLAHELRNPMASIAVANNVMVSLGLDHPRLDKLTAIVKRQCDHLVRLVDDLLDASRIATGKLSLHTRRLDLREVLDSALETAQPLLAARAQCAQLILPAMALPLEADAVRLSQLFSNLLINASKFSAPEQPITLSATQEGAFVVVRVRDHGKGIAACDQACIFDLFAQGADERAHAWSGGLGIGLTLVRAIAALHGGQVRVDSAGCGCGSEFIVELPLATGPA